MKRNGLKAALYEAYTAGEKDTLVVTTPKQV